MNHLPATILSGFLGAGKTTLLNRILSNRKRLRVALIVNDMAELNIDAGLIQSGEAALRQHDERLVEMTNGCICCTLRDDLLKEVAALARQGRFDYLIVESTGVSEPLPVAQAFTFEDSGQNLRSLVRLDTLVTVVDAPTFWADFRSREKVEDRDPSAPAEDRRNIADLLTDQIEFADVVLINKIDLVNSKQLDQIVAVVKGLNPIAEVIPTQYCEIPLEKVMHTGKFDYEHSMKLPAWERELSEGHKSEIEEYGISSFSLVSDLPFHPQRLFEFFQKDRPELLRAKGWFHLATVPKLTWNFHLAGGKKKIEKAARVFGKKTQLVVIGRFGKTGDVVSSAKERDKLHKKLAACLATEEEIKKGSEWWSRQKDPFAGYYR